MALIAYAGLPRQGKSYSVVENVVIPALKARRHVAHNLPLNVAPLSVVVGHDVASRLHQITRDASPDELMAACPPGAVIVIDEVWRYWPAGVKVSEVPRDQLAFFKEHGHRVGEDGFTSEIVIIDQDPLTALPAWIRSLVELTYIYTKHSRLGSSKRYRCDVYAKCQGIAKPSRSAKLRTMQGRYDPKVFACYTSHTQAVNVGEAGMEVVADGRAVIWKDPKAWLVAAAVVALPFMLLKAASTFANFGTSVDASKEATVAPAPATSPSSGGVGRSPAQNQPLTPVEAPPPHQRIVAADLPDSLSQNAVKDLPEAPPLSVRWRVQGGALNEASGRAVVVLVSATGRRLLDETACDLDDAMQWHCTVEDGRASPWSGGVAQYGTAALPPGTLTANR